MLPCTAYALSIDIALMPADDLSKSYPTFSSIIKPSTSIKADDIIFFSRVIDTKMFTLVIRVESLLL